MANPQGSLGAQPPPEAHEQDQTQESLSIEDKGAQR